MVEGPLEVEEDGTWVSNLVLTAKKWDTMEKQPGDRIHIRGNLDCRPLNKVVYQTHEPILEVGDGSLAMYFLAMFSFLYMIPTPTPRVSCKITSNKNTYC